MNNRKAPVIFIVAAIIISLLSTAFVPYAPESPTPYEWSPELSEEPDDTTPPAPPDPRNIPAGGLAGDAPLASFINNGTIMLGVRDTADLNVPGGSPSVSGTTIVGLRYLPTNAEATAAGCTCEGWGLGDNNTSIWGGANSAVGGVTNLTINSFTSTADSALSDVNVGSTFRIIHDYHPSPHTPLLYEVIVTIENISGATVDPIYRRAMDWDIEPTEFNEHVTIQDGGGNLNLLFSSDNGFADSNVFNPAGQILFTGTAVDSGPDDHGAVFDFGFSPLAPGEAISFRIFYGAGGNETDALNALSTVEAQVYSLGQTSTDPTGGTPNTFIFGFGGPAGMIGDYVWEDVNQDGIQDAGETGVNGVLVNLYTDNGDLIPDPATDFYKDTIASYNNGVADGYYEFSELISSNYFLEFVLPTGYTFSPKDQGGNDLLDSDVFTTTGRTDVFFLPVFTDDLSWDAGMYGTPTAKISDFVWQDIDRNGLQDNGEPGLNGIGMTLYQDNGDSIPDPATDYYIDTTVSYNNGTDGYYEFPNLAEANYFVVFDLPSDYFFTTQDVGADDTIDSDVDPATGYTAIVFVPEAFVDTTVDAGYILPATVGDIVWEDTNINGIQDGGEPGVNNVTVDIYQDVDGDNTPEPGGDDGAPVDTTTTDSNGVYTFTVVPEDYFLEFTLSPGQYFVLQDQGGDDAQDSDADPSTGLTDVSAFDPGETDTTWDAGLVAGAGGGGSSMILGNRVWIDDAAVNGIQDGGESGLSGVVVNLFRDVDGDGLAEPGLDDGTAVLSTTTDINGIYTFTNMIVGDYFIEYILPGNLYFTTKDAGGDETLDSDADPGTGLTDVFTFPGLVDDTRDAGMVNQPPVITSLVLDNSSINENDSVQLDGAFTDPEAGDAHVVTLDWGDGLTETLNLAPGTLTFTATHQYLDDDPTGTPSDNYTIGVTVDDGYSSDFATTGLTVNNVAPALTDLTAPAINENGTTTLSGTFSDPGTLDTFELILDWGDGITQTLSLPAGSTFFTETHTYLDDDPSGTPFDNFTIGVTLTDDDTGSDTDSTFVTVINVAPALSNLSAPDIDENGTAILSGDLSDPGTLDTFELLVDWGDSFTETVTLPAGTTSFTTTHTYPDDDPTGTPSDTYTINLILTDDDTGFDTDSTSVTINNVAPALANLAVTDISENDTATLTGEIVDPGTLDTFELLVDWGDGSVISYTYPASTAAFTETHTYLDGLVGTLAPSGTVYTVSLTLTDDDTGMDTASLPVSVNNVPPSITSMTVDDPVFEGDTATLNGVFTDPGSQDTFSLAVDWGDGTVLTSTLPAGTRAFTETHMYVDDNPTGTPSDVYTVTATLMDDEGGTDTEARTVTVDNVAPALSNISAPAVNENGTTTLSGNISDPGTLDTFELLVDWGDGAVMTYTYPASTSVFSETHTYLDDDPTGTPSDSYTIGLTLTDDDTGSVTDRTSVTVDNVAPALSNLSAPTINENGTTTLSGNITDPGTLDTFKLLVDWGDGAVMTYTYAASTSVFTETHQYLDDDPSGTPSDTYTIGLTLTDDDTGSDTDSASVTVNNVAPIVDAGIDQSVPNGVVVDFSGSFTDTGTLDTHTILWDFGDSTTMTGTLTPSHTYPSAGVYTATLAVTDDDTGVGSDTLVVTVTPAADLGITKDDNVDPAQLGGTLVYTLTVTNFGPDTAQNVVVTDTLPEKVTWLNDTCKPGPPIDHQWVWDIGSFAPGSLSCTVTVSVDSAGDGVITNTVSITSSTTDLVPGNNDDLETTAINTAPELVNLGITDVSENEKAILTGNITDPDADSFTLIVDWTDGWVVTYTYPPGTSSFSETHTYLDDDPSLTPSDSYTVTLALSDNSGGSDRGSASLNVNNVAPALASLAVTDISENDTATLTGEILDPGTLDTFELEVDWGDGTVMTYPYLAGTTVFTETHTYLDGLVGALVPNEVDYTINLTLTDDDTGMDTASLIVSVNNVPPTITSITVDDTVLEGGTATLAGAFTDPGTQDTFSLVLDWGEGTVVTTTLPAGTNAFTGTHVYVDDNPTVTPSDTYTVSVTLMDDEGGTDTAAMAVVVENVAPTVDAGMDQTVFFEVNPTVSFSGMFTDPGILDTHTILWDFGDGTIVTGGTLTTTHTYTALGEYTVNLTVIDDDGGVNSDTLVVRMISQYTNFLYLPIVNK